MKNMPPKKSQDLKNREINIPFIDSISTLDKVLFARQLSLMIKSGLSLREAVATVQDQAKSRKFKKVLKDVINRLDNGQSLSDSLSLHSKIFDPLYLNVIRIGEESGTLEENLRYLAEQLEKNYVLKRKIKSAMIYPSIIILSIIALVIALSIFILPQIVPIFSQLDVQLPLTTRILIRMTEVIQNYGIFILIAVVALIIASIFILRLPRARFLYHKFTLKVPVIGIIMKSFNLSQFGRTLGILLKSGIPAIRALEISQETIENLVYQQEFKGVTRGLKRGKSISDYLKTRGNNFPLVVSRMISVGEKTGNLEETLFYISDFYEAEVDRATKNVSSVLEPFLLLIIGFAIGFVALAIISPIYEITKGLEM